MTGSLLGGLGLDPVAITVPLPWMPGELPPVFPESFCRSNW